MPEAKCKNCDAFIIWIQTSSGWRPFDYGLKKASGTNPLTTRQGDIVTSGKGFIDHFTTCGTRVRKAQEKVKQEGRERQARRKNN